MNIQQLYNNLSDLNKEISTILKQSGFDTHNDLYDLDCGSDPDSLMLREELTDVLDQLDVVHNSLDYLNKKIAGEYTLHKNKNDRYSTYYRLCDCDSGNDLADIKAQGASFPGDTGHRDSAGCVAGHPVYRHS